MNEIIYQALVSYYNALEKTGYMSNEQARKLLVLIFYRDFMFNDYDALLSNDDYNLLETALNCLYGTSCLLPYPDYCKMGSLHLNATTEILNRLKSLEDTYVLKAFDASGTDDSDIVITSGRRD